MIRTLDRAIAELVGPIPSLRAAVLSVAPDGLVAWCWSREAEREIALHFARLDRAATLCLESLGAAPESRSMMLSARDTWVVAWPLYEDGTDLSHGRARMVLTVVFSGELQNGMVVVYGRRVLTHLRTALDSAKLGRCAPLREQLVELILAADEPSAAIERLAAEADIELRRLERLDGLADDEQLRLTTAAAKLRGHAANA